MTILTAHGSFADAFLEKYDAEVASIRELNKNEFEEKVGQASVIIHNASTVKPTDIDTYLKNNFDSTRQLVGVVRNTNPETRIIILSSMSILDMQNSRQYADVTSMTPYAYSKYLSETYGLKSGLKDVSIVRFSTLFYMDPDKDGLSKLIHDAVTKKQVTVYNDGEALRDFMPLEVAVDYTNKIVLLDHTGTKSYTIGSGKETSFKAVVDILKQQIPELEIINIHTDDKTPVLSKFHTEDIEALGEIEFDLGDYIITYIEKLKNEIPRI